MPVSSKETTTTMKTTTTLTGENKTNKDSQFSHSHDFPFLMSSSSYPITLKVNSHFSYIYSHNNIIFVNFLYILWKTT